MIVGNGPRAIRTRFETNMESIKLLTRQGLFVSQNTTQAGHHGRRRLRFRLGRVSPGAKVTCDHENDSPLGHPPL